MYNYSPYSSPYGGFNSNQYNYMPNAQNGLQGQIKSLIRVNGIEGAKAYQVMPLSAEDTEDWEACRRKYADKTAVIKYMLDR